MALVLALDVSSSVDEAEDRLQRNGLARALLSPDVQDAFFLGADPVALQIFEWSGRGHQTNLIDWVIIENPADLEGVAAGLTASSRSARGLPTAMGYALAHASVMLQKAPACSLQTIDMAGDGANNAGFGPQSVYATFPFEGVTVNGLVIQTDNNAALDYYDSKVIRGPLAFVEVANGFADFEAAMRRKLIRELSAQVIGRAAIINGEARG
ncbi:DUF1194 domain-containing protein [Yoonia sp.]|uniref:DUF1194 domain-containing protein n=1 Tax=Yoonia sp. TaxID=2212373 RepID=UPI0035C841C0